MRERKERSDECCEGESKLLKFFAVALIGGFFTIIKCQKSTLGRDTVWTKRVQDQEGVF